MTKKVRCMFQKLFIFIWISDTQQSVIYANNRPHDRVPLKEMKADWHACLNNRPGFKVDLNKSVNVLITFL